MVPEEKQVNKSNQDVHVWRMNGVLLMQKQICKHKGLIPDSNVKACQPI